MANKPAEKIDIAIKKSTPPAPPVRKSRIEPLPAKDGQPEPALDEQIASNKVDSRPPSSGLDGGFSADMSAETSAPSLDKEETANGPVEPNPEEGHDDSVYGSDEDFYSSKLDPAHHEALDPEPQQEEAVPATKADKASKKRRVTPQYLLVLATFVTVSLLGLFILHALETTQEGAGIIFDWLR